MRAETFLRLARGLLGLTGMVEYAPSLSQRITRRITQRFRRSATLTEIGTVGWRYLSMPFGVTRRIGPVAVASATVTALAVTLIAFALGSLTRGPDFHVYADQRTWLGIAHVGDVLSNLAFTVGGAWLLTRTRHTSKPRVVRLAPWLMIAIGLGSALYHHAPTDATLVADWIPIGLTLACILGAVAGDRLGPGAGAPAALTLGAAELLASIGWYTDGGTAGGNLRGHVAVQVVGVVATAILILARPGRIARSPVLAALALFALARVAGSYDLATLDAIGVSGHAIKHLLAAAAATLAIAAISRATLPAVPARAGSAR